MPGLADAVRALLADLLKPEDGRSADVRRIAQRLGALPVRIDMAGLLALTPEGAALSVDWKSETIGVQTDPRWRRLALAAAGRRYPALAPFAPPRPADAVDCPACGGSGSVGLEGREIADVVCRCDGLGWLPGSVGASVPASPSPSPSFRYEVAARGVQRWEEGEPFAWTVTPAGVAVAAVADGSASWGSGRLASRLVPRLVVDRLAALPAARASFEAAFADAARTAHQTFEGGEYDLPADVCVAAVHVSAGVCLAAWAGDCCVALVRDGTAVVRTRTHRMIEEVVAEGHVSPREAAGTPLEGILSSVLAYDDSAPVKLDLASLDVGPGDAVVVGNASLAGLVDLLPPGALRNVGDAAPVAETLLEQVTALEPGREHSIVVVRLHAR